MEVKTTGQNSNWSQRVPDVAPDAPVTFESMLKTLAYRTEDVYKRLTPLELKAREEMEIDIQSRVSYQSCCTYDSIMNLYTSQYIRVFSRRKFFVNRAQFVKVFPAELSVAVNQHWHT